MKRIFLVAGTAIFFTVSPSLSTAQTTTNEVVDFIAEAASGSSYFDFDYESRFDTEDGTILSGVTFGYGGGRDMNFKISLNEAVFEESPTGQVSITLSSPIRYFFLTYDEEGPKEDLWWEHHESYRVHVKKADSALLVNLVERNIRIQNRDDISTLASSDEGQIALRIALPSEISWNARQYGTVLGGDTRAGGIFAGTASSEGHIEIPTAPDNVLAGHFRTELDQIEIGAALLAREAPEFAELFGDPSSFSADFLMSANLTDDDTVTDVSIEFRKMYLDTVGIQLLMSGDLTGLENEALPFTRMAAEGRLQVILDGGARLVERLQRILNKDALLIAASLEFLFAYAAPGPNGEDSKLFDIEFVSDGSIWVNGINFNR